jgi:ABC-type multidrug transport system fused ATPase/permease subunit
LISQPISNLVQRLWRHISPRRRTQFGLLLILMLLTSFAEILSIGAVLPFLGVMTAPQSVFENPVVQPVIRALGLNTSEQLLFPLTVVFCFAALFAGGMRLLLLWATTRLSFTTGAELSISIYRRTLYQPYPVHCARNSSEVISGISNKASNLTHNIIVPVLTLISSTAIMIAVVGTLLIIEPVIAILTFVGFASTYFLIVKSTRKKLLANSQCVAEESVKTIKALQEGMGGIRDVLIDGSQSTYCKTYANSDLALRRAQGNSAFIGASPRYTMESLGMLLIAVMAYSIAQQPDGISKAIPILGAVAIGAQRLLPALQHAYASWSSIRSGQASLQDTIELLEQPLPDHVDHPRAEALPFSRNICLKGLGFRYTPQTPYVLKELDLVIPKGSRAGFVGTTGSGKSTLIDVVMGLLSPTDGLIEVDGQVITPANSRAWQAHIAHVPQAIFLTDSSIEENIAFGVPKEQIDQERVKQAAQQAKLSEVVESWPEQYQTLVGERGVRLSGGQRQRIGIARALYKQADLIIFDEATSALDSETEEAVMQAIECLSKDLTILIIAHRVTTLKNCTQIIELRNGGINRVGSYQEFYNQVSINP